MKKLKENKSLFYGLVVASLVLVVWYAIFIKNSEDYNKIKIDKSKKLVYTVEKKASGFYYQYKPYLNIKGELGEVINNDINTFVDTFNDENIAIAYEYDLNGNVLSLVIKVQDHSYAEAATVLYFRAYNINLKDSEILSNEKLLNMFDITTSDAEVKLDEKIRNYYDSLVEKYYIDEDECNYSCFLDSREFNDENNKEEYYVKNGKLYAFKPYTFISTDEEQKIVYKFKIS